MAVQLGMIYFIKPYLEGKALLDALPRLPGYDVVLLLAEEVLYWAITPNFTERAIRRSHLN